jgi:hypothetical protein
MMIRYPALVAIVVVSVLLRFGAAYSEEGSPEVKPALKSDPAIMAILKGLGDNSSALLPAVKTTGEMNAEVRKFGLHKTGPRPRNYCLKWVWAPDRKRALFCGANARVPHRLNDVWEYDLASNTWVLLWNPDPNLTGYSNLRGEKLQKALAPFAQVKDGVLMTKRGAPFDPVHTWGALTYDPELKALLWIMGNYNKVRYKYETKIPHKDMRLWAYYPYKGSWEYIRAKPCPQVNTLMLEYVPELKGSLWYSQSQSQVQLFKSSSRSWQKVLGKKDFTDAASMPFRTSIFAYAADRQIVVAHNGGATIRGKPDPKRTFHYDVKTRKWQKVLESSDGPVGYHNASAMVYDPVARRCLLVHDAVWSYSLDERKWTRMSPKGPALVPNKGRIGIKGGMTCYNPEHNVTMVDTGKGRVWVYRQSRRKSKGGK